MLSAVAQREFRLPASVGLPLEYSIAIDKINDPSFTTALGLASWAMPHHHSHRILSGIGQGAGSVRNTVNDVRGWFKKLLP